MYKTSFESYEQFWENRKKNRKMTFLAIFGLILDMFLTSQQYDFHEITPKGP